MTVRWGEGEIRFRISLAELRQLELEGSLEESLSTGDPESSLQFCLEIHPEPDLRPGLEVRPGRRFCLKVPTGWCSTLGSGRSRSGLSFQQGDSKVSLQVNLRSREEN